MDRVDVILPAGGRIQGDFAREAGAEIKALIVFDGKPILERTLETLRATGRIGRAVVIGPPELADHPAARAADAVLPEGASGIENLFRGLDWLREHDGGQQAGRVLVVTTDLPFLTADAIRDFLDACPESAAISLPVIGREAFEARFPCARGLPAPETARDGADVSHEYVRMRDGEWTMGCAFLVDPVTLAENRPHLERIFEARKSQIGMLRLLGLPFILRWLTRRLTVGHIEARCSAILGCAGAAVRGCAPELAYDIDLPAEYRYAMESIAEGRTLP